MPRKGCVHARVGITVLGSLSDGQRLRCVHARVGITLYPISTQRRMTGVSTRAWGLPREEQALALAERAVGIAETALGGQV